jgi:hypothetical protein
MAFETHANVKANPFEEALSLRSPFQQALTTIPSGHEEQGEVSSTSSHGTERDDVSSDDHPPPASNVEESLPGPIYRVAHFG